MNTALRKCKFRPEALGDVAYDVGFAKAASTGWRRKAQPNDRSRETKRRQLQLLLPLTLHIQVQDRASQPPTNSLLEVDVIIGLDGQL